MNNAQSRQGVLVVISAPSGCGKTTIVERLLKRHPEWARSVSATTRAPRVGEKDGKDYYFLSHEAFVKMRDEKEFLESAEVFGHLYGTPKKFVDEKLNAGTNVILAIDVQGAKMIRNSLASQDHLVTVFVLPPSVKVLRERLEGRNTDSPEEIERRIQIAQDEIKEADYYDSTVVNQNLDQTVSEVEDLIEGFKKKRSNKV